MSSQNYPIGTPGQAWGKAEKARWLAEQKVARSYKDEVLERLQGLDPRLVVERYGSLSYDPERFPLMSVRSAQPKATQPWVLITGGVHGYETSGVQGALAFLHEVALDYVSHVNLLVLPCVSPWGYEIIHRWNPQAIDPNRSFLANSPAEESAAVIRRVAEVPARFLMHIDLHETTDTDESEFRPALAARDGTTFVPGTIPDGFYLVGDHKNPQLAFQKAIITRVSSVTHIAPSDDNEQIIGVDVAEDGVILYDYKGLGLCAGVTDAPYTTTTEVYPDSEKTTAEICNKAQVTAIQAAIDFVLSKESQ